MEQVNSFEKAIQVTIDKLSLNESIDIVHKIKSKKNIKKLILKALDKTDPKNLLYFTSTAGARDYIRVRSPKDLLGEMTSSSNNDLNAIIDDYVNRFFEENDSLKLEDEIERIANIDKVEKKIRYLSTESIDDNEFYQNVWSYFSNCFVGKDSYISYEEIRADLIEAALKEAEHYKDEAIIVNNIDPNDPDMDIIDAIKLVEKYIDNNKSQELMGIINKNPTLSGLLIQNLLDHAYFNKNNLKKITPFDLDEKLSYIPDIKTKAHILKEIIDGHKVDNLRISNIDSLTLVLQNAILLNIYSNNKENFSYDENSIYAGHAKLDESIIHKRIKTNSMIVNDLLSKGMDTTESDLANIINKFDDKTLYFLCNMYVVSRSYEKSIDNLIYYGNKEQIHVYNLLESKELKKLIKDKL